MPPFEFNIDDLKKVMAEDYRSKKVGYHINIIEKGTLGEPSKILEEVAEFQDAVEQGVSVMAVLELSDLLGAMEAYLEKYHPTIKIDDLKRMSDVTRRAFKAGQRS